MGELLDGTCLCYTMEVSFFSYAPKDNAEEPVIPYFRHTCKLLQHRQKLGVLDETLGKQLGAAILKYHGLLTESTHLNIDRDFQSFLSKRCARMYRSVSFCYSLQKN